MIAANLLGQTSQHRFHVQSFLLASLLLTLTLFARTSAAAQTTDTSVADDGSPVSNLPLSMHEAVRLALRQNPRVLASRLEALESKQQVKIARSTFLPKAGLQLEEQMTRLNLGTLIGQEAAPYSVGPYSNLQLGSSFDVPVIAASAWKGYQAEEQRDAAAQWSDADLREQVVAIVVAQYLSLQRSKATEKAVQSRIDLADSLRKLAEDALQQGTGTNTDALRANVELKVEQQNLVEAQAQTSAYGYALAQVLGLAANQQVTATEELSADDEQQPDEQASLKEALQARSDLLSVESLRKAAVLDRQSSMALRLPELHFGGFWAESGRSPSHALPAYTFQGEMRFPIFTGGRTSAEIKRSGLASQRAYQIVKDRRNVVSQEVRTSLTLLQAARQELQLATQAVDLSTHELKESRDRFAAGITNNIEVVTAQNSLAQSSDSQIGAMYRLQQATADLSRARGRISEDYAK